MERRSCKAYWTFPPCFWSISRATSSLWEPPPEKKKKIKNYSRKVYIFWMLLSTESPHLQDKRADILILFLLFCTLFLYILWDFVYIWRWKQLWIVVRGGVFFVKWHASLFCAYYWPDYIMIDKNTTSPYFPTILLHFTKTFNDPYVYYFLHWPFYSYIFNSPKAFGEF